MTQEILETPEMLAVGDIENGTVLDHITPGMAVRLLKLLGLVQHHGSVTVGMRLPSASMGSKDVIKVEGWQMPADAVGRIAVFAPTTTVCCVQNYRVSSKKRVSLPEHISGVLVCPNRSCISNHGSTESRFQVRTHRKKIRLQCCYCEKAFLHDEIAQYSL